MLLERKDERDEKNDVRATAARRWVQLVNTWSGLAYWTYAICHDADTFKAQLGGLAMEHGLGGTSE